MPNRCHSHKASYSNFSPKIGCHGNIPQHLQTSILCMISWAHPSPWPKQHLDRFSRFCTGDRSVPILYNGTPLSPQKNASSHAGDLDTWFPGPTWVLNPNGMSVGAAVFAGLTSVTDRPSDRPTDGPTNRPRYSVSNVALQCGLIIQQFIQCITYLCWISGKASVYGRPVE